MDAVLLWARCNLCKLNPSTLQSRQPCNYNPLVYSLHVTVPQMCIKTVYVVPLLITTDMAF